ncbi:MAG TPA: LON peptidase substrate-binding domain-containing protein, partial [Methylomirabilota bacterium]|nr:LON peptidase substrate-binding domain-containing protein [Methylomirabilota bacterium]
MADDKVFTASADPRHAGASIPDQVPILPLRDTVLFPQSALPLGAGRESSVRLLEDVVRGNRLIGVFTQRDASTEEPQEADLHRIGTLATVHKILKQPDGSVRLVVQGPHRIRIVELSQVRPYLVARIAEEPELSPPAGDLETEALARNAVNLFRQVVELSPMLPDELTTVVQNVTQLDRLGDLIAATLPALTTQAKQELLETPDVKARLARLVAVLTKEAEVLALGSKIQSQVESEVGKSQREYYLREQLKAIQKELGATDDRTQELDELREKVEAAGMTEEAKKEALRELDRLSKMPPAAAEYTVARTYLDWLLALPWSKQTTDNLDIAEARRVLDADHSGLEKVKDRILEYLAVKSMRPAGKDPILCFVGPPGVG